MHKKFSFLFLLIFLKVTSTSVLGAAVIDDSVKNILYINSYHVGYSWGDSISTGVISQFRKDANYRLYVEYLDAKRFGSTNFKSNSDYLQSKFHQTHFDGVILSDNAALDFMLQYGNELAPNVPVAFCGINNPENYNFDSTLYYGITEGGNLAITTQLILRVMPKVTKLYFIGDNTVTSMLNIAYAKSIEHLYKQRVKFEYITNVSIDSLYQLASKLDKNSAVASVNVFRDIDGAVINSDIFLEKFTQRSVVPVFTDSETSFGKGIIGGYVNIGVKHGKEVAVLMINMLENANYKPNTRIGKTEVYCFFDYLMAKKFNIDVTLFPKDAVVINKPQSLFQRYLFYILVIVAIIVALLAIILVLGINISRRIKAEANVEQKLFEIEETNACLEEAYSLVNDSNEKLEQSNKVLVDTNKKLVVAREEAETSNKLKSSFLANLSHEIRTPLNAIVGFSSLLNDETFAVEDRRNFIAMVLSNSNHLLDLINDILEFSQVEAGAISIKMDAYKVNALFDELSKSFYHKQLTSVDYRINMNEFDETLRVVTDGVRFKQILINFYSNAIKFTKRGFVELGCKRLNGNIVFYVQDSGIGISAKDIENIFDRFWKVEDGIAEFEAGTGLGLAISYKLAHLLGGEITVSSEKGLGSTFSLVLPEKIIRSK